ncbi:hypothetical protein D3C84_285950 [compost metagenome]
MVTVHIKGHFDSFRSAIIFSDIWPTRISEPVQVSLAPCWRKYPLHLIDQEKCPLGRPMIEPCQTVATFLGFGLDIKHLKAIGYILTKHLTTTLDREAAHVGNNEAARFDSRDHIGMNGAGRLIRTRSTVMDFNRHGSPPEDIKHKACHKRLSHHR